MAHMIGFPSTTETMTMTKGEEVAMRIRKAFLSSAVVAAAVLLAAPSVMATGSSSGTNIPTPAPSPPPPSCSVPVTAGGYTIQSSGPSVVSCDAAGGQCTEIGYTVSGGTPDHVAVLEGVGVWSAEGNGIQWYKPGVGDPVTDLGELSYHEQAVKFNPTGSSLQFKIRLAGIRLPSPTTVATKKGYKIGACRILGIGLESGTNPLATATPDVDEVLAGKCKVRAHTENGVTTVTLVDNISGTCADPVAIPFGNVTISVGPEGSAPLKFSEGLSFILGTNSCTYKQYYPPTGAVYKICY